MNNRFDQFVNQQVELAQLSGGRFDPEREIAMWIGKLEELYALVQRSLAPYLADGRIGLAFTTIQLTEDWLGTYEVRQMSLTIGRQIVRLEPRGTVLIGARGRVAVDGPRGTARLTLVPADATAPQVRVSLCGPGEPGRGLDELPCPENWVWKIAIHTRRVAYIDLVEENFLECLMGVVNG